MRSWSAWRVRKPATTSTMLKRLATVCPKQHVCRFFTLLGESSAWISTYGIPPPQCSREAGHQFAPAEISDAANLRYEMAQRELQQYVDEVYKCIECGQIIPKSNPFLFWEGRKEKYPSLYGMAMKYLVVAPTSVGCERVFSSAGLTDTVLRSRLTPDHLSTLVFLKQACKNRDVLESTLGRVLRALSSRKRSECDGNGDANE